MLLSLRRWHRWVSTLLGLFLLVMAGTGALLQSQFLIHGFPPAGGPSDFAASPDFAGPGVPPGTAAADVTRALGVIATRFPDARIESLQLAQRGASTLATLTLRGVAQPVAIDTASGREVPLPLRAPPPAGKLDLAIHQLAFNIHTGQLFHLPGEVMTLLCGLSLLFLAGSGIWLLVRMYLQRLRAGKRGVFWS